MVTHFYKNITKIGMFLEMRPVRVRFYSITVNRGDRESEQTETSLDAFQDSVQQIAKHKLIGLWDRLFDIRELDLNGNTRV